MAVDLEPSDVLEFLEDFMRENDIGDGQRIATLLEALEDEGEEER
jgi:hypothetical protein